MTPETWDSHWYRVRNSLLADGYSDAAAMADLETARGVRAAATGDWSEATADMTRLPDMVSVDDLPDLDPNDARPSFVQLVGVVRAAIADGRFGPGDRLPSRAELQQRYGVAGGTVTNAMRSLITQGLVVARPGKGVFVRSSSNQGGEITDDILTVLLVLAAGGEIRIPDRLVVEVGAGTHTLMVWRDVVSRELVYRVADPA
jgi:DNA-binding transcriptional regulator YhcF (GntR family)